MEKKIWKAISNETLKGMKGQRGDKTLLVSKRNYGRLMVGVLNYLYKV